MTTTTDSRIAAPVVGIRRQGIAPRTATVGLHVVDTPLQRALHGLATRGQSVPCWGREDLFTANDRASRMVAELRCVGCPVFAECDQDATDRKERNHVWGGKDRTPGAHPIEDDAS